MKYKLTITGDWKGAALEGAKVVEVSFVENIPSGDSAGCFDLREIICEAKESAPVSKLFDRCWWCGDKPTGKIHNTIFSENDVFGKATWAICDDCFQKGVLVYCSPGNGEFEIWFKAGVFTCRRKFNADEQAEFEKLLKSAGGFSCRGSVKKELE